MTKKEYDEWEKYFYNNRIRRDVDRFESNIVIEDAIWNSQDYGKDLYFTKYGLCLGWHMIPYNKVEKFRIVTEDKEGKHADYYVAKQDTKTAVFNSAVGYAVGGTLGSFVGWNSAGTVNVRCKGAEFNYTNIYLDIYFEEKIDPLRVRLKCTDNLKNNVKEYYSNTDGQGIDQLVETITQAVTTAVDYWPKCWVLIKASLDLGLDYTIKEMLKSDSLDIITKMRPYFEKLAENDKNIKELLDQFDASSAEFSKMDMKKNEIDALKNSEAILIRKHKSLGFFAGKEKRAIMEELQILKSSMQQMVAEYESMKADFDMANFALIENSFYKYLYSELYPEKMVSQKIMDDMACTKHLIWAFGEISLWGKSGFRYNRLLNEMDGFRLHIKNLHKELAKAGEIFYDEEKNPGIIVFAEGPESKLRYDELCNQNDRHEFGEVIIELLRENEKMTLGKLREKTRIDQDHLEKELDAMVNKGILKCQDEYPAYNKKYAIRNEEAFFAYQ